MYTDNTQRPHYHVIHTIPGGWSHSTGGGTIEHAVHTCEEHLPLAHMKWAALAVDTRVQVAALVPPPCEECDRLRRLQIAPQTQS